VKNLISVSSAPIAAFGDKRYFDLVGTLEVMNQVFRESVVDGFELQLEPEWDSENPPLSDAESVDWTKTPKFTVDEVLAVVEKQKLPILSVHANRDIGGYLCSNRERDHKKGKQLVRDSLFLASSLGAEVCVFHLWDTWKKSFDVGKLKRTLSDAASQFPRAKASVENIPTHLKGHTPFSLVEGFDYVTLDIRWASMYNEFDKFESIIGKVVNVHLRGSLREDRWFLDGSNLGFYEALDKTRKLWNYSGLLTVEPEGKKNRLLFGSFVKAMRSLKT